MYRKNKVFFLLIVMILLFLVDFQDKFFSSLFGVSENFVELGSCLLIVITFIIGMNDVIKQNRFIVEGEEFSRTLVDISPVSMVIHQEGGIVYANPSAVKTLGVDSKEELLGKSLLNFVHVDDKQATTARFQKAIKGEEIDFVESRLIKSNGEVIFVEAVAKRINYNGKQAIMSVGRDISKRKKAEETIKYMAYHDILTGLPNRKFLDIELKKSIARSRRKGKTLALMFMDLDGFKEVNDKLGHHIGDLLLKKAARRINRSMREEDMVARLGGDEFIILMEGSSPDIASKIAQRIIEEISIPFYLDGHTVNVTSSIGISFYPTDSDNEETLLIKADHAMYHAKGQGKNTYRFYDESQTVTTAP